MHRLKRFRPTPALAVAMIALFLALTGTGIAAAVQVARNSITSIHVKDRSLLAKDFRRGQIPRGPAGPQGPAGPAGPQGPAGPAGPAGTANIRWAVFRRDGGIAAQSGGITLAAKPSAGQYIVNIGASTAGKLLVVSNSFAANDTSVHGATTASPCGAPPEGLTCSTNNDANHVVVHTTSGAGALEDHSFYIAVFG